jgi:hypothetical protein
MAQSHHILGNLSRYLHERMPCTDIKILEAFAAEGIDLRIFQIERTTPVECLRFLFENDYPFTIYYLHRLMSMSSDSDRNYIADLIIQKYSDKVDNNHLFFEMNEFASYFIHHLNICSKEIVKIFIHNVKLALKPSVNLLEYCVPEDYLQSDLFKSAFLMGDIHIMKFLIEAGYVIQPTDFNYGCYMSTFILSLKYLKDIGQWDGLTCDWKSIRGLVSSHNIRYYQSSYDWLKENHCPQEYLDKLFVKQ